MCDCTPSGSAVANGATACCGCCEGITQETPQPLSNRAGLSAIAYRAGSYPQFYATLLARIAQSRQPALRQLRSREPDDFTIALLDAFSVMGDVLTFYSERYQNEAYLTTATQRTSVRQLAALVGYRMQPGVAAQAYLAFTIDPNAAAYGNVMAGAAATVPNAANAAALAAANASATTGGSALPQAVPSALIPVGTQIQSIPGPGQMPQTFETVAAISARAEWNAITPLLTQIQWLDASANAYLLSGSVSNLKNGDWVLAVVGGDVAPTLKMVLGVSVSADGKTTEVDLAQIAATDPKPAPPAVFYPSTYTDDPAQRSAAPIPQDLATLQAAADLPTAANLLASSKYMWDANDIVTAAVANQWPLDQLGALVNQQVALVPNAAFWLYAFRQQAAPFGYNAPNYYSLPAALTVGSYVQEPTSPPSTSPPTTQVWVAGVYSAAWDSPAASLSWYSDTQLYLDSLYTQIVPGSYIVLRSSNGATGVFQVVANQAATVSHFAMTGKVSLLTLTALNGASLASFTIRDTAILCQSESLTLAQVPVTTQIGSGSTDLTYTLAGAYPGLLAGQDIVLSGTTTSSGRTGPPAAEAATLASVAITGGNTVVTLESPLANTYVRSTVAINANVAPATHGQTVTETLGNGDGTQAFQSFTLHQSPLTYTLADTAAGTASTLQVWVDGVLWQEAPYFYGHGPNEHIYVTAQDDSGITTITFGNGVTGSRLPTGTANITASYRFGIGTVGLVNANQLSQLMNRPLGVRSATNPLPSSGAADPEDLDSGRGQASLQVMTLGRVVSLEDYEDFALAFPGIGKALATWTWNGQQRVVVLTVAGAAGPISSSDPRLPTLSQSIAASSEPGVSLYLFPYTAIYFNLNATVQVSNTYQVATVSAAIESALRTVFGFNARSFGQPVYASELIAVIQNVPGVIDLTLSLYASSDPYQTPVQQIAASVPGSGGRGQITPAQLLTIDPGQLGITTTSITPFSAVSA